MAQMCLEGERECLGHPIRYYIVEEALDGKPRYGLSVIYRGESILLPGMTDSIQQIRSLLERMMRGGVTPVSARDVVEDWLLE